MISEPAPTEVMPTAKPPITPISTVRPGCTTNSLLPRFALRSITVRTIVQASDSSSATPIAILRLDCTAADRPILPTRADPAKAAGTDPSASQPSRPVWTVRRRRWTTAPTGFITRLVTRSLEMAASGATPKNSTSSGVSRAPPPMPVRPTSSPTRAPAIVREKSRWIT
jgi:hypothetical protein